MTGRLQIFVRYGSLFALLSWASFVTYLSSLGQADLEPYTLPFPYFDKLQHLCAFAGGAAIQAIVWRVWKSWSFHRTWLISAICISAFGMLDEIHQLSTPTRSGGDIGDWTADTLGAIIGAWIALKVWPVLLTKLRISGR